MTITARRGTLAANLAALFAVGGLVARAADPPPAAQQSARPLQSKPAKKLTIAEFEKLHKRLRKMSRERVWSIPWQLSVREARERAARERKPVFLWISSNGGTHPLGPC